MGKKDAMRGAENIQNLVKTYEAYKGGYCYMTTASGIYLKSVYEAIQDIQIRAKLGAMTRADILLLDIISQNVFASY